jgi:hypothetical protein
VHLIVGNVYNGQEPHGPPGAPGGSRAHSWTAFVRERDGCSPPSHSPESGGLRSGRAPQINREARSAGSRSHV